MSAVSSDVKGTHETPVYRSTGWASGPAVLISIFVFIASQLVAAFVYLLLTSILSAAISDTLLTPTIEQFMFIAFSEAAAIGLIWFALRIKRRPFNVLGFSRAPKLIDLAGTFGGYFVYFVLFILIASVATAFLPLNPDQEQNIGFDGAAGLELLVVYVSLAVLPPLTEEILFRGFLFGSLRSHGQRFWTAAIITSAFFALPHLFGGFSGEGLLWFVGLDTFVLSLVLCYVREKTGALWASIGIHAIKNSLAFIYLFVVVQ